MRDQTKIESFDGFSGESFVGKKRTVQKHPALGAPFGGKPQCRCGNPACPQCGATPLEPGFIHEGP